MPDTDFKQRFCKECKGAKNAMENGVEVLLRCTCDWMQEFIERLRATVSHEFWRDGKNFKLKTINNWDPALFKSGGIGEFKGLIEMQKAVAVQRLFDFCFTKEEGRFSIYKSIERCKNLFVRGPVHSGRGLLTATIKIFCAMHDISVTPNPADWSTFKGDILAADWNGRDGEEAKMKVSEQYMNVKILSLENIKGEGHPGERGNRRPFRGSQGIDALLTKRSFHQGSLVFTSSEFAREIGDSVGDKIQDILDSDNTSLILMFSPAEADALLEGVRQRMKILRREVKSFQDMQKKGVSDEHSFERAAETFKDAYFLDLAFESLRWPGEGDTVALTLETTGAAFPPLIVQTFADLEKIKQDDKSLAYQQGMEKAYKSAAGACKELASKMSHREMVETGKMMSNACNADALKAAVAKAVVLKDLIRNQKASE